MKLVFTPFFIVFFFVCTLCAQNKQTFPMCISYDMELNFNGRQLYESILYCNNMYGWFSYQPHQTASKEKEDDSFFQIIDTVASIVYTDLKNEIIIEGIKSIASKEKYVIEEELTNIDWVLGEETKHVNSLLCHKATTDFRGRSYTVWYTMEVPCNLGPWKLHGLPGAVLEASDERYEVVFRARKIMYDNTTIDCAIEGEKITREQYQEKLKNETVEMMKKITSKMGRSVQITISKPQIKTIEIYE